MYAVHTCRPLTQGLPHLQIASAVRPFPLTHLSIPFIFAFIFMLLSFIVNFRILEIHISPVHQLILSRLPTVPLPESSMVDGGGRGMCLLSVSDEERLSWTKEMIPNEMLVLIPCLPFSGLYGLLC